MQQHPPRFTALLVLILIAVAATQSRAEQPVASSPTPAPLVLQNLSDGAIPLDGPWQFHLGDDPSWAAPAFDDSQWEQLTANKPWGEQSHPGYAGIAWYRRHIAISSAGASSTLALMVRHIDDAYEIYWNGQLIGQNGQLPPHAVWYAQSQPAQTFGWSATGSGVLAVRVWKAPLTTEDSGLRGGFSAPPVAGTAQAITAVKSELDYQWLRSRQFVFGEDLVYALVALIGFLAWLRDRHQWALLWMSTFAIASIARLLLFGLGLPLPRAWADGLADPLSSLRDISLWFLLLTLLRLRGLPWLIRLTVGFSCLSLAANTLDGLIIALWWTSSQQKMVQTADAVLTAIYIATAILPLILVTYALARHVRQDTASRLLAVMAFLSGMLQVVQNVAPQGSRFTHWTLADRIVSPLFVWNGNAISIVPLAQMLLLLAIVFAVYRFSLEDRHRQIALEQEMRDARELQQVLIPETPKTLPGFLITSSYVPAAEVGGDFLQLIPAERDHAGATLVIIGDVSGKGLRAAMSVALIVGAVRTLVESTSRPADILDGLNRRLCGRMQGGFVTCLILRLHPDGTCILANAGHPPPFVNKQEMELSGALPLGLISDISYSETRFTLQPNDQLTLYTDGLLEARSSSGELYGFERMFALFATRPTADEAARAAVEFGQDDDTTILTLTRLESPA